MAQRGPSAAVRPGALSALLAEMVRSPPEGSGCAPRATDRPRDAGEVLAALMVYQRELERGGAAAPPVRRRHARWTRFAALIMVGVAVGIAIAGGATRWNGARTAIEATPSVAVLPFTDLSPQRDQEYFADGVAEEIRKMNLPLD